MSQKNGYIQVEIIGQKAVCHVHPPVEDGEPMPFKEADAFLKAHGFTAYDEARLQLLLTSDVAEQIPLGACDGLEFAESMTVTFSVDHMDATCRFYPPSTRGQTMNAQDIIASLEQKGVKFGIDQDALLGFLKDRRYATDIVLAAGQAPVHGRDASIEYFFNTDLSLKPKHNEDGTVDYHDLNTIASVQKGDLLARLTPEDKGVNGTNVLGQTIPARNVKSLRLEYGANITANEEKTEIFSDVTGHVMLTGGKVFVSNVYEVPADVDNSTGNIDYDGNVHVNGNVRGGFIVKAKGDIVVDGVVEDAYLQADGQIIVKRGIHGINKGTLKAGTNVICQFVENAKVFAGGYVETSSILHSEVSAGEDVIVKARKGFITGGVIRAGSKVDSMTIGSAMGAATQIEVGILPARKERFVEVQKEVKELTETNEKLTPVIAKYQTLLKAGTKLDEKNTMYLKKLIAEYNLTKGKLAKASEEYGQLQKEMAMSNNASVVVQKAAHPGVVIVISDMSYTVKKELSYVEFRKIDGDVTFRSL